MDFGPPMFRIKPKYPVTPEQREWLDRSFGLLADLFGIDWVRTTPLVLPTEEFFPRRWEATEDWAGDAFGRVCDLMHVDRDSVHLEFMADPWDHLIERGVPLGWTKSAAGTHHSVECEDGVRRALIHLQNTLVRQPELLVGVMSHELAHVLLLDDGKISRDMERMEPLTDLMTVFSGFGVFTANAAHTYGSQGQRSHGYLSQREYGYALALFAWERGETSPSWLPELTTNVRAFMKSSLACFRSVQRPLIS